MLQDWLSLVTIVKELWEEIVCRRSTGQPESPGMLARRRCLYIVYAPADRRMPGTMYSTEYKPHAAYAQGEEVRSASKEGEMGSGQVVGRCDDVYIDPERANILLVRRTRALAGPGKGSIRPFRPSRRLSPRVTSMQGGCPAGTGS